MKSARIWTALAAIFLVAAVMGPNWMGCKAGIESSGQIQFGDEVQLPAGAEPSETAGEAASGSTAPGGVPPGVPSPGTVPVDYILSVTVLGIGTVTSDIPGVNCGTDCSKSYAPGAVIELTAATDPTHVFLSWAGACSGSGTCRITMDSDKMVSAQFIDLPPPPANYSLTVINAGTGSGNVTSSDGNINCGDGGIVCAFNYPDGTAVRLKAMAASTSDFAGWSDPPCPGLVPCDITMTSDMTIDAVFNLSVPSALPDHTVRVLVSGAAGDVKIVPPPTAYHCTADCTYTYPEGTHLEMSPTGVHSTFRYWSGTGMGCVGSTVPCAFDLNNDVVVIAYFQALPTHSLTIDIADRIGGRVKVDTLIFSPTFECAASSSPCTIDYEEGTIMWLKAEPDSGYYFKGWGGAITTPTVNPVMLTLDADKIVKVVFKPTISAPALDLSKPATDIAPRVRVPGTY